MEARARAAGNLSPRAANRRLRGAIVLLAVALGLAVGMVQLGLRPEWRLLLAVPFFLSSMGFYQGLFRTCPGNAARGTRETDELERVKMCDPDQLAKACAVSRRVVKSAILTALGLTALFFVAL
jgi:hypothetical protein